MLFEHVALGCPSPGTCSGDRRLMNQINALHLIRLFLVVLLTRQYDNFADNMRDVENTNALSVPLDR